jgi:hypothetical protein
MSLVNMLQKNAVLSFNQYRLGGSDVEGQLAPFADMGHCRCMSIYADDVVIFLKPRVDDLSSGESRKIY